MIFEFLIVFGNVLIWKQGFWIEKYFLWNRFEIYCRLQLRNVNGEISLVTEGTLPKGALEVRFGEDDIFDMIFQIQGLC